MKKKFFKIFFWGGGSGVRTTCAILFLQMVAFICLQDAISQYYRFIWNLFYAEYIFFPLI